MSQPARRMPTLALTLSLMTALFGGANAQERGRVLVMPFENATGDGRVLWLSEASAVLLTDDLNALGVEAIGRGERRAAFDRLQVPPSTTLSDATVIRIGQLLGASRVVVGRFTVEGDALVVQARSIDLDAARVRHVGSERGAVPELYATFERLARALAPGSDLSTEEVEGQHPPIEAFEQYIKGLVAETPATAVQYLNAALVAHPEFARPRLALWEIHTDQGAHERALAAVRAVPVDSRWSSRAMFLAGLSYLNLDRLDDAFRTWTQLASIEPDPTVFNNLGVVQLRRGGAKSGATYYFGLAAEADPDEADYCFNLGYAYWRARDSTAAIHWLREAVRRDPADGDAHYVLSVVLAANGNRAEANRERDLARRLSAMYETWKAPPGGDPVPPRLERLKASLDLPARRLDERLAAAGQREQLELAAFHLAQAERLYGEERDREALEALDRALFLSPYDTEAHLLMARIHLRAGRLPDAIDALKISLWSAVTAEGHALLADAYLRTGDRAAALEQARRALALDPGSVQARYVLEEASSGASPP
jgi:tetratricopeptide (TPR) repeat protein